MVDDRSSPSFHVVVVVVDDPHGLQDVLVVVVELFSMLHLLVIRCCRSCRDADDG